MIWPDSIFIASSFSYAFGQVYQCNCISWKRESEESETVFTKLDELNLYLMLLLDQLFLLIQKDIYECICHILRIVLLR